MEGIVIVDKGLEEIANKEILEKIKSKGTSDETTVKFKIKKEEELCKLAYTAQSIKRVLLLIKEFKIEPNLDKTIEIFKSKIKKTQLKKIIDKKICIECERIGEHDFNSTDATKEVGKILADFGFKISRKEFDIQLFLYINQKKAYFCIDFSGRDLSKRNYRIFTKPGSLKGTLGYAVVRMSGYKPGETIVDPLCESGIICIETALMALRKPVHFYKKDFAFKKIDETYEKVIKDEDKHIKKKIKGIFALEKSLKSINDSKKNSKIAGVEKNISFSKVDIEWLDTKFEKESIDKIVTKLPSPSKRISENILGKSYQELFYQAAYVLKKKGVMSLCVMKNEFLKKVYDNKNFKIISENKIFSGQQEYFVVVFQKNL